MSTEQDIMTKEEVVTVEDLRLNQLWLEFLENNILWFLLKEIPENCIEDFKTVSLIKLSKYVNDSDILHWEICLTFGYKGEWICFYTEVTDPEWGSCEWSNNSKESFDIIKELEMIFSGMQTNLILNQFLETVLNEEYELDM